MASTIAYNPSMLINTFLIPPPRNSLNQHYLLHSLRKDIQPIRKMYDHESGADFIEMLELRQGFNRSIDLRDKIVDQFLQICFYRPHNYSKKRIYINGKQYEVDTSLSPISDSDSIYWIFIIQGQVVYRNQRYKSGSSIFIDPQYKDTLKESNHKISSQTQNSKLLIFQHSNLIQIKKLMYLRERKRKIQFLSSTPFKCIGQKKMIGFFNQITSLNIKLGRNVQQKLQTQYTKHQKLFSSPDQQFRGIYDEQSQQQNWQMQNNQKNIQNCKEIPSHVFIVYKGQVSVKVLSKNFGESKTEVRRLTKGSVFCSKQTLEILQYSNKLHQILSRNKDPNQKQPIQENPQNKEHQQEDEIKIQETQEKQTNKNLHRLCFEAAGKIQPITDIEKLKLKKFFYGQIKQFNYFASSQECVVLAVPTSKIIQISNYLVPRLRRLLIKIMKQRIQKAKQILEVKSQRKIQQINRQTLFSQRTKQTQSSQIQHKTKIQSCLNSLSKLRMNYMIPQRTTRKIKMPNMVNSLYSEVKYKSNQKHEVFSQQGKNKKQFQKFNTIATQDQKADQFNIQDAFNSIVKYTIPFQQKKDVSQILKKRANTMGNIRKKQKRSQGSPVINSTSSKFFVPQQFCSKKLKMNYQFMLDKMRKNQDQMNPKDIQPKSRKNQRDYVRQFIDERRIVKKFPARKFLPIYNGAKRKVQKKQQQQQQMRKTQQQKMRKLQNLSIKQRINLHSKTMTHLRNT